jgi:hypothetical protein
MTFPDAIGSLGVGLLLGAFLLNLTGWLRADARAYRALNALGAGLACYAAWMIDFIPFVVLEGAWSAVAIFALVRGARGEST